MAVAAVVMLGGCSHSRSAAQNAYLVDRSRSLGRCTMGEEGGDSGPGFDPMRADNWNGLNTAGRGWARVVAWKISSKPKDPPGDMTVDVTVRFEALRGDRGVMRPTVGAHERDAKSIARALDSGLEVFVGIHRIRSVGPYVSPALALDHSGRLAWLGECASRSSDSTADALERARIDPKVLGRAIRQWMSNGDTRALLHGLTQK
jgi:hypothetical protein